MKKVICGILTIVMFCCFAGCGNDANNSDEIDASELKKVIEEMVMSDAKQRVVNELCEIYSVEKLKINYGTEEIVMPGDGKLGTVGLKGYCYPIDEYGRTLSQETFSYCFFYSSTGEFLKMWSNEY